MPSAAIEPPPPPASCTDFRGCGAGLACMLVAILLLRGSTLDVQDRVLLVAASAAVPIGLFDLLVLRVHRRASTGLDWTTPFAPSAARVATKLLGLAVTLAAIALAYWTFPEYQGSFYDPFYALFKQFWPGLIASTVFYFILVDTLQKEPEDPYWQVGAYAWSGFMDSSMLDRKKVKNHYVGWLVKAYFFPLMYVWLTGNTHRIINFDLSQVSWGNLKMYDFLYDFIFFFDLLFATVGYVLSFRALDTHVRSAEPTMLGWTVALFCYEPFFRGLFEKYGGNSFESWLAGYPYLRQAWGAATIFLVLVYVLSTITFGARFSNLTNRGILTNGPYRFTKHPAYVSKNLSWWLTAVPFLVMDGNVGAAIKRCLGLLLMNFIYFMRARTEERHLSRDPTYVQYALWMNEHGVLRVLNRVPRLRYRAPE
jgi:protein-S-isoprenylcysteine O-methyltransferase Ste14